MKARMTAVLICLLLATGCTYRGQVRRGIYQQPASENRMPASVLVIADTSVPTQISFTEPDSSSSLKAYRLQTADGVLVAVTDALGTRFEQADAGDKSLSNKYDFVAEVSYQAGLTRSSCEEEASSLSVRTNGLCTRLRLTLRRSQQEPALWTEQGRRWEEFLQPGFPSSVQWLNKHTFSILFPVLDPLYVQTQGIHVRHTLEKQLKEILQEMMSKLDEKRELFSSAGRE